MRKITVEELAELYETISNSLGNSPGVMDDADGWLKEMTRLFHTITGTAAMAGFEDVSKLASVEENYLHKDDVETEVAMPLLAEITKRMGKRLTELQSEFEV